jgi:HrpA-like RNA helicase
VVTEPQRIAAVSLAHRVAEERGCPPPGAAGSSMGYMVRNDRLGHLPSCQIIYMTIGMLLNMLVLDRGGAAAAADDVNNGGLSYGNDNDDNVDDKE